MEQILDFYGYRPKHGFICCPFHGEKEPSLKIYGGSGGWCCFGCGRKGSVIDFVMEHEGCSFPVAVNAIDNAFHLCLRDPRENPFEADRRKRRQEALDRFVQAVYDLCDAHIKKYECEFARDYRRGMRLDGLRKEHSDQISADDWTFLLSWKEEMEYREYMVDKLNEMKEEVAAWRRKARRTG